MRRISDYTMLVQEAINALRYPVEPRGLYAPIAYGMEAGGKRLRPVMLLMAAEAFGGGEAMERAVAPAVGYELFHNFTLLHDDVMDNSELRRGRKSVMAKWDTNTAILSGDTMLTLATEKVAEVPDALMRPLLGIFNRMAIDVYEGQRMDMDFETRRDVTPEEYTRMISLKTGALMGAALQTGALLGGASEEDARHMHDFGMQLGVAFQMEDDWLDTFGDPETFGKPIGGDILNNKQTYLLVSALKGVGPDREALLTAVSLPPSDTKVKAVTRLYQHMGVKESARRDINSCTSRAMAALKATSLGDAQKEAFRRLVDKLASRKK